MKKLHFIAIGGAAMHSLALALHHNGDAVTGSDDKIFEPSYSRLKNAGLLPEKMGWDPDRIHSNLDAVILGMHAAQDNPELIKAQKLELKIFSYPEFLYEQTKQKRRVIVGGSHGKTTVTAMILHVLKTNQIDSDYMVGSRLEGYENTVNLDRNNKLAVFEGDEYLSSALDPRPKFHLYRPHIAVINGIAWDHINVFPTFEIYKEQFAIFIRLIEKNGVLCYYEKDEVLREIIRSSKRNDLHFVPFTKIRSEIFNGITYLQSDDDQERIPLHIFGDHNLQNIAAAHAVCRHLNLTDQQIFKAISSFQGTSKRLQLLAENDRTRIYFDFAHSPSKVDATIYSVRKQYPGHQLIACLELHTFSSLTKSFLKEYSDTMKLADIPIIYYNPDVISKKGLSDISGKYITEAFNRTDIQIFTDNKKLETTLSKINSDKKVYLLMSSGDFGGWDMQEIADKLV